MDLEKRSITSPHHTRRASTPENCQDFHALPMDTPQNDPSNPYLPPQVESPPLAAEKPPLKDPRPLGWLALGLIALNCLASFAILFMPPHWFEINLPQILQVGTIVPAAIVFWFWIHRCAVNALVMDRASKLSGAGWAVGCYFIPFVNWVVPCLTMNEIASSTFKYRRSHAMFPVILIWWLAFLTRNIVGKWSDVSVPAALVWLAAVAIAGTCACYLIARISVAQAAFRWSDAPAANRPVMVALERTGPGHGPRMLPNSIPAPRPTRIPAQRLVPPPAPRPVATPPPPPAGEVEF